MAVSSGVGFRTEEHIFDEKINFFNMEAGGGGGGRGGGGVMSRCHCSRSKPEAIFQILSAANPDPFMFL